MVNKDVTAIIHHDNSMRGTYGKTYKRVVDESIIWGATMMCPPSDSVVLMYLPVACESILNVECFSLTQVDFSVVLARSNAVLI
jgi:hypothetical protein